MGSPIVFSGNSAKLLKPSLDLNGNSAISSGTINPTVTATAGNPGSIYLNSSSGNIYKKNDSGVTTNWTLIPMSGGNPRVSARYGCSNGQTSGIVNFSDLGFDPNSLVTIGAAWKFTAPFADVFDVSAIVTFNGATYGSGVTAELDIYKNGVQYSCIDKVQNGINGYSQTLSLSGSDKVSMSANDYIDIRCTNNGGLALAATSVYNHVAIGN